MKERIIKPSIKSERDQQVPDFGGYKSWELHQPAERPARHDVFNVEARKRLRSAAISRAAFFAYGIGEMPHVYFPNAEHFQHIPFAQRHWDQYGNLESEYAKIHFMLDNYPSRSFPVEFLPFSLSALQAQDVLGEWSKANHQRQQVASDIFRDISRQMHQRRVPEPLEYHNGFEGAYQSALIFYQSSDSAVQAEKQLWLKGLLQIAAELRAGDYRHVKNFLELYDRVKDPITCVLSNIDEQVRIFSSLYQEAQRAIPQQDRNDAGDQVLIAQLALEASFLALPAANEVFALIYGKHHELPYVYLDIEKLPRGELANPVRVEEVFREIIEDAQRYKAAVVTPIMVSYYQEPNKRKPELGILDGNNRATAMLLFKYMDSVGYDPKAVLDKSKLDGFVKHHGLAIAWERDMALALRELNEQDWLLIQNNRDYLAQFARSKMPALLVQEPNFDTIAVALSDASQIVLLQPMHQALYNQKELPMAIPSKQQSHGRTEANDVKVKVKSI